MPRARVPAARVSYSSHLFRAACEDVRTWLHRRKARGGALGLVVFLVGTTLAWLVRGSEVELVAPLLWGLGAVLLFAVGVFFAHWGYLTPRRLCASKQHQLEAERRKFIAALDKKGLLPKLGIRSRCDLKELETYLVKHQVRPDKTPNTYF